MKGLHFSVIGGILLSACTNFSNNFSVSPQQERVDLLNPKPGQVSRYEMFMACTSSYKSTGDTLLLEVIEKNGALYYQESFTQASPIKSLAWGNEVKSYPIRLEGSQLHFPPEVNSFLWWFLDREFLDLVPKNPISMEIRECSFHFPGHLFEDKKIGFVPEFRLASYVLLDQWICPGNPNLTNSFFLYTQGELQISFFINISFSRGFRLIYQGMDRL
ncbi:MAG: hypothetical protein R8P61_11095 [Bacteroidia bacterium]|nr:hypothetical protein [Bacteroidia bacterium]